MQRDRHLADVSERGPSEPFGRADAAAANDFLERAWATLRHDEDLIEAGAVHDMAGLCGALCGHLGCALRGCRVRCDSATVQQAIAYIHRLAHGAWLPCDIEAARARALAAVRQVAARTHDRHHEGPSATLARLMVYRAWRPYVDVLHDLHGRMWGVYGPFWALVARRPRVLDGYHPSRQQCLTPRAIEAWLEAHHPAALADIPRWMEVDEGHGAAGLARMRAVALAKVVARGVVYPAPGDTLWAAARRKLALTLAADPNSRLTLRVKERTHVAGDGDSAHSFCVRKVTLYARCRACPLTTEAPARMVVARVTVGRDSVYGNGFEIKADRVTPTVACLQRLGVGKYTLDAWVRAVAQQDADALYTTALLDVDGAVQSPRTTGANGAPQPPARPTIRRSVALDGCTVAALVHDAYMVQTAVHNAAPRLFCAAPPTSTPSATSSHPVQPTSSAECRYDGFSGVPIDQQAAVDAETLLCGSGDVPQDRIRAAVRYATWRVCRAGGRDGYDCVCLAALLERAGLTTPPSLIARLTALWG
ncbi:hypothetical protein psal_cds_111 [Pandoravirus salinus]|uniref:Uncharacterized protein n=1 Tax=Pandoravirus salinus TaxID=1349410 RepID=S4VTD2_9VIRU|nr:hypothetical protein psal_cds_111 [Pandoravirus salinus]AGO83553.1 hypothetical protein psal_cds_111 [Pandoravirus salinus]